jgi:hypothetical protein
MSINKLISIRNPIVDAMDFLNIDHDKLIPKFTRFAEVAEKEIGSWVQYEIVRKVIPITNCTACLPNDAIYIQVALLGDHGEGCADLMNRVCTTLNAQRNYGTVQNTFFVIDMGTGTSDYIGGSIPYQMQNNKLVFEQNYDGQSVTIQYLRYKVDCDGFMEVGENHVQAIKWYIVWQYLFGKSSMNSLEYGKMNKAEQEWHRECAHARAQDAELSQSDRTNMVRQYHNPFSGIGLSVGMNTTLGGYWSIW